MNFRTATLADLPTLLTLEQGVVDAERPFNANIKAKDAFYYDIEALITSDQAQLLVVEEAGEIIACGYSKICTSKDQLDHDQHAYLGFMYVSPAHRGKGLNAQVMQRLIDWSQSRGIKDFYLDVYSQNTSAIRAYEKLGFSPCLLEMKLNLPQ